MKPKPYWIKERRNPQIGVYFVAEGQLSAREAKGREDTLYGVNIMHRFDTEQAYQARLAELRASGERVQ